MALARFEGGNFAGAEAELEHWLWSATTPAMEMPAGADEAEFRALAQVEDLLCFAFVEALRKDEQRFFFPQFPVG